MQRRTTGDDRVAAVDADGFRVLEGRRDGGLVVLCDHASNALPAAYGTLGLAPAELERHIAYDIGARAITERIARAFDAPAVLTRYSRLLIDPNRGADDPTLIMRLSDGAIVPGNRAIDEAEREVRTRRYYRPYHDAIETVIEACLASGRQPAIVSVHSFTESWKGVARPWHVGILWDRDQRLARPVIEAFAADGQLIVGDNEPYRGSLEGDSLWQHATARGLPNVLIEYRQDLVRDPAGQTLWADRTIAILAKLLDRPDLKP